MKIVLATRRSKLALTQARAYAAELSRAHPDVEIDELEVVTSGDRFHDRTLQAIGGKGLFIKEIEEALHEGRADFAVHSMKDVPGELAAGLTIAAIPSRVDPRDALVIRGGGDLDALRAGARVGTCSLRRSSQLCARRADLHIVPLRGNVDTRLRKLDDGGLDAIVLALAGLLRMGLAGRTSQVLEPDTMLPAVGQGALGIECRANDERMLSLLEGTEDPDTRVAVEAERALLRGVGGSCELPVAGYCLLAGSELWLRGMLADPDGSNARFGERRAPRPSDVAHAIEVAKHLGSSLGQALRR